MEIDKLTSIMSTLYANNEKIQLKEATKYIGIINLRVLDGKIDYTLAYNLVFKILNSVKPFYYEEVKSAK